ncbi:MAG: T9SS type A sorting domain-containing protein, partial [Calditrichota bacterium]
PGHSRIRKAARVRATPGRDTLTANPFNSTTRIRFGLPVAGMVELSVCDLSGKRFVTLAGGQYKSGYHEVIWDAKTVPVGTYMVTLQAEGKKLTEKVTLVK